MPLWGLSQTRAELRKEEALASTPHAPPGYARVPLHRHRRHCAPEGRFGDVPSPLLCGRRKSVLALLVTGASLSPGRKEQRQADQ